MLQDLGKSALQQDQFGGSIGGPIAKSRAFFFGSFERYRLNAGINIVEAVPSAAAWSRAVPAIAPLRSNFFAPAAIIFEGKSSNPDFDIAQLQSPQIVTETAASGRFDFKIGPKWSSYLRSFTTREEAMRPTASRGVSSTRKRIRATRSRTSRQSSPIG